MDPLAQDPNACEEPLMRVWNVTGKGGSKRKGPPLVCQFEKKLRPLVSPSSPEEEDTELVPVATSRPLLPSTDPTFPHAYSNPEARKRVWYRTHVTLEQMLHARSVPQNTDEWLALRSGIVLKNGVPVEAHGKTIGASAVAKHLGYSPYGPPQLAYEVDIGNIPPQVMGAPEGKFCFLEHGHEMEPATLFAYCAAMSTIPEGGIRVYRKIRAALGKEAFTRPGGRRIPGFPDPVTRFVRVKDTGIYYNPEVPFMHASVDGLILQVTPSKGVITTSAEAKSPVFKMYESIPVQYVFQMMQQKLVVVESFMDEFSPLFPAMREELGDHKHLLPAFDAFVESLSDGKDKEFAMRLFDSVKQAAAEGREFTATDVFENMDGADIEFMGCWWANEGKDRHPYTRSEGVCAHLRVWRIKYNHGFALHMKRVLEDYVAAVNTDPPDVNDPRVWRKLRTRFAEDEDAFTFQIARVVEGVVISQSLARERGAEACFPFFRPDVAFPFYEQLEGQLFVRDEHGAPAIIERPSRVPDDAVFNVRWYDETDFGSFTLEQIETGAKGIKMSCRGP